MQLLMVICTIVCGSRCSPTVPNLESIYYYQFELCSNMFKVVLKYLTPAEPRTGLWVQFMTELWTGLRVQFCQSPVRTKVQNRTLTPLAFRYFHRIGDDSIGNCQPYEGGILIEVSDREKILTCQLPDGQVVSANIRQVGNIQDIRIGKSCIVHKYAGGWV